MDFAAFGAFGNAGQTCAGVERIYVVESVYQEFLDKLTAIVKRAKPGGSDESTYGPMTLPRQIDIVRSHIEDALASGGTAVVGGAESVGERIIEPVILTDVPETSRAVCEETFGPTVVVNKVRDLDEAVDRANGTSYGLGASIFIGNKAKGRELAERLRNGMVSVNSVLGFAGIPSLPFGGIGESGFGRIHGATAPGVQPAQVGDGREVQLTTEADEPRTARARPEPVREDAEVHARKVGHDDYRTAREEIT